jgi:hypothetical protein
MKKIAIVVAAMLMLSTMAFAADSWTGIVSDTACAKTAKVADSECVKKCTKDGGAVLVVGDKVVKIANIEKIRGHEGHTVIVTGKMDGDTLTIDTLKMAPKDKM